MSFIMSAATTGLSMAGIIILTIGLLTVYWRLSSYFGRPWGVLITRLAPLPQDAANSSDRESTRQLVEQSDRFAEQTAFLKQTQLEATLAGMVGVFLWIAAAGVEIFRTAMPNTSEPRVMWTFLVLLLKSGLEALIAKLVSAAAIRLVGWA
ncbi:hypothetical protein Slin15195_G065070 [Septoria linicola]|uniref:Uncharacterized protein n=1 Tax=Septoria linicola TaxID=215465 RepID=A0A9Q9AW46_9PEZI|nr:hypothetical protein Slin14017_G115410 [Septoria linicola]USW53188.1 hypothetical protein Slin15195_G065070 [Septoria linicola]